MKRKIIFCYLFCFSPNLFGLVLTLKIEIVFQVYSGNHDDSFWFGLLCKTGRIQYFGRKKVRRGNVTEIKMKCTYA